MQRFTRLVTGNNLADLPAFLLVSYVHHPAAPCPCTNSRRPFPRRTRYAGCWLSVSVGSLTRPPIPTRRGRHCEPCPGQGTPRCQGAILTMENRRVAEGWPEPVRRAATICGAQAWLDLGLRSGSRAAPAPTAIGFVLGELVGHLRSLADHDAAGREWFQPGDDHLGRQSHPEAVAPGDRALSRPLDHRLRPLRIRSAGPTHGLPSTLANLGIGKMPPDVK